jgi:hypothetical protein
LVLYFNRTVYNRFWFPPLGAHSPRDSLAKRCMSR